MLHNPAVQVLKSKSALTLKYEQQVLLENYLVAQLDTTGFFFHWASPEKVKVWKTEVR